MDLPSPLPRRRPLPEEILITKNEIENLENSIEVLEGRIQDLQKELHHLRRRKQNYESFISPLKRLPTELVRTIVEKCIHDEISIQILSQICGYIRDIVIGIPSIWCHIHIVPRYRSISLYEQGQWVCTAFFFS
jgi:hypothetical protein